MSKFTSLLSKVTPNLSFHVKRVRTIAASTGSMDEQAPTMKFKLCSYGVESIYMANVESVCISSQLEARLTRFLQDKIESIAQIKFEDLPGSESVVFYDVPAVSLGSMLPIYPLSAFIPVIPSIFGFKCSFDSFTHTYTLPRHLFVFIHHMFVPSLVPAWCVFFILLVVLSTYSVCISTLGLPLLLPRLLQAVQGR